MYINSSPPSVAYIRQWIGSFLLGTNPLPEPMLAYCRLDGLLRTNFSEILTLSFSFKKMHLKCCLPNWQSFCPGGDELRKLMNCLTHWSLGKISVILVYTFQIVTIITHKSGKFTLSTVATDALVLKHQAISACNADQIFIASDQFQTKISYL